MQHVPTDISQISLGEFILHARTRYKINLLIITQTARNQRLGAMRRRSCFNTKPLKKYIRFSLIMSNDVCTKYENLRSAWSPRCFTYSGAFCRVCINRSITMNHRIQHSIARTQVNGTQCIHNRELEAHTFWSMIATQANTILSWCAGKTQQ